MVFAKDILEERFFFWFDRSYGSNLFFGKITAMEVTDAH